ncbi:MAG: hypothetical protein M1356_03935 [Gammaproteobacteria bacterium]|nr:hypothetical protein [Gammaproteobacteria bacterium]
MLTACTTGRLEYITADGERKFACETEYTWQPSVDKYAVEYVLAYCAQQAVSQGYEVIDTELLALDLSVPNPPVGQVWNHTLAKREYKRGQLTNKEYGYLIASLDLFPSYSDVNLTPLR